MMPPWKNQDYLKDTKKLVENTEKVQPLGDYRFNERAKVRKFDALLGLEPSIERKELLKDDLLQRELTDMEKWELDRFRSLERSKENSQIAFKRDEGAWADEDGYAAFKEVPKFRDGFNNTEFIKPLVPEHLHNGTKLLPDSLRAQSSIIASPNMQSSFTKHTTTNHKPLDVVAKGRAQFDALLASHAKDSVHRQMSKRADLAHAIGTYFMRAVQPNFLGSKNANLSKEQIKRHETISKLLGNAFVNIGTTLPLNGKRDDPLRNDSIALKMGLSIMNSENLGIRSSELPKIEESLRHEVAIALGRTMLHLRQAANIEASRSLQNPTVDKDKKILNATVGRLAVQLIENAALRSGEKLIKDRNKLELIKLDRTGLAENTLLAKKQEPTFKQPLKEQHNIVKRAILPVRENAHFHMPRELPLIDRSK